jgi:general secretion pathway protein C
MDFQKVSPHLEKGIQAFVLVLVVALAHQSAKLTLMSMSDLPMKSVTSSSVLGGGEQEAPPNIQQLLEWNIFGELGKAVVVEVEEVAIVEAPETKLSLTLQGVSVSPTEESSSAIISEARGSTGELYWVGDSVLGKAVLVSVHDDKIVLKQNGRLETLRFSDEFQSSGLTKYNPAITSSSRDASQSDMLRSYRSRRDDKNNLVREMGSALNDVNNGKFNTFDALLDEYGANLENNIESAARSAGLEESSDGVKVGSRAQKAWMNKVGLKEGDVIKSVNSYPVLTLKSDRSAIDSVIKSCLARIEVQRGQNIFVVTYPFCK